MVNEKQWKATTIIPDCEHPNRLYVCRGNKRYIFEDGKYIGWYKP